MIGFEEDLLLRTAQGDVLAFEKLTKVYYRPLHAFFYRMSSDSQYAENLAQETLLRMFKYSKSFDASRKAKSWIFSIAANVGKDWSAKRARTREIPFDHLAPGTHCVDDVVQTEIERRQQSESISKALGALDEKHRQVFILKHFHNMRYHEIAAVLDTSEGTVKSRMHYACRQLRKLLPSMGDVSSAVQSKSAGSTGTESGENGGTVVNEQNMVLGGEAL